MFAHLRRGALVNDHVPRSRGLDKKVGKARDSAV